MGKTPFLPSFLRARVVPVPMGLTSPLRENSTSFSEPPAAAVTRTRSCQRGKKLLENHRMGPKNSQRQCWDVRGSPRRGGGREVLVMTPKKPEFKTEPGLKTCLFVQGWGRGGKDAASNLCPTRRCRRSWTRCCSPTRRRRSPSSWRSRPPRRPSPLPGDNGTGALVAPSSPLRAAQCWGWPEAPAGGLSPARVLRGSCGIQGLRDNFFRALKTSG